MAGGSSQRVAVWNATSGDLVYTSDPLGAFELSAIQFSPDGSILVASSKSGTWVFDTSSWTEAHFIANPGQPSWVIRFTPDGREMLTAEAHTGTVAVYDTESWEQLRTLEGGAGQSRDMALSSDGSLVALSSNDGLVHVLLVETGEIIEILSLGEADVTNVEFVNDDRHLLVTDSLGPVQILTLDVDELVSIGLSRVTRPFTEQECLTYHIDPCPPVEDIRSR
jgi:WD40 repeat protein